MVQEVCGVLASGPYDKKEECYQNATDLAAIPQDIRGFGHVKVRAQDAAMKKWNGLLTRFRACARP
jgi:hypothetical protein